MLIAENKIVRAATTGLRLKIRPDHVSDRLLQFAVAGAAVRDPPSLVETGIGSTHGFRHQMVLIRLLGTGSLSMRSTINLDDTLLERARSLTGTKETAALVRQALETLVRVESGKRLIALGGTMPDAEAAPRRRSETAK